uniref:uncharacterized protein LOC122579141 n=1 Tax=Erigeron canadensis TaxID=72917 RepID=UPI001CB904F8|nr:uncharacterized protein LOC122579141 [Erigeron canadensis]
MEQFNLVEGSGYYEAHHQSGGDVHSHTRDVAIIKNELKQQIGNDGKKAAAAVNEEINKVKQLPPNSSYATHRMRVLNKILQLLSLQRTTSQDEELELLFAGLSI